jgi:hypothetical protein
MRRIAAFLSAVAATVLAMPAPAHAATGITGLISTRDSGAAGVVQGDMHWDGGTRPAIDSVRILVAPAAGQAVSPVESTWCTGSSNGCGSPGVGFSWTTPALTHNGPYQVTVTATGSQHPANPLTEHCDGECQQTGSASATLRIAVPPAMPRSATASADPAAHAVKMSWGRNMEPDTIGYAVQRKAPGESGFQPLAQVAQPPASSATVTYTDATAIAGGAYGYQVVAVRRGGDESQFVTSNPASASALVEGPPPTAAGGGTGGSSGGSGSSGSGGGQQVAAPGRPPILVQSGTVDASKFSVLQSQVQIPNSQGSTTATTIEPDTGFDQALPFRKGATTATTVDPDGARFPAIVHAGTDDNRKALLVSLAFAAIVFIIAFHVRYLMRRIDQLTG